jgi:hypothetical protein
MGWADGGGAKRNQSAQRLRVRHHQRNRSQTQGEEHMNFNQGTLADGLVDDLFKTIHKYDETLYMATVIGVLELVKQQLINESVENQDDDN